MNREQNRKMASTTVGTYQGEQNLLLIFAPNENDPEYQKQCKLLEGRHADLTKRDVLTMHLFADGESNLDGTQSASAIPLELRERYGIAEDQFSLVLVDKSGALQMKEAEPLSFEEILSEIDALK